MSNENPVTAPEAVGAVVDHFKRIERELEQDGPSKGHIQFSIDRIREEYDALLARVARLEARVELLDVAVVRARIWIKDDAAVSPRNKRGILDALDAALKETTS